MLMQKEWLKMMGVSVGVTAGIMAGMATGILGEPAYAAAKLGNTAFLDEKLYRCVVAAYQGRAVAAVSPATKLTAAQLKTIRSVNCRGWGVKNTKGVEKLTGLTSLILDENSFSAIDLSKNKKLEKFVADDVLVTTHATATRYGSAVAVDFSKVKYYNAGTETNVLITTGGKTAGTYRKGVRYRSVMPNVKSATASKMALTVAKTLRNSAKTPNAMVKKVTGYGIPATNAVTATHNKYMNWCAIATTKAGGWMRNPYPVAYSKNEMLAMLMADGYTKTEANCALKKVATTNDWKTQAITRARQLLSTKNYTKANLITVLRAAGFTKYQAEAAVKIVKR